jgi:hypothetical protein
MIGNVPADCETLSVSVEPAPAMFENSPQVETVADPHPEVTAQEHAEAEASPLPTVNVDPELAEIAELVSNL